MSKINISYFIADDNGNAERHLCSVTTSYVPEIGGKVFLKEDGYDFSKKRPTGKSKFDGHYIVKSITPIIHNKFCYSKEEIDGETYTVPSWETRETLEITVIELESYAR